MLTVPRSRSACLGGGGFLASCPPITAACRVMCASPPRRAFRRAVGPAEPCLSKCAFRIPRRCPDAVRRHPFASLCATSTTTSTSRWDEKAAGCLIWRRYRRLAGRHAGWMSAPGPADRPQAPRPGLPARPGQGPSHHPRGARPPRAAFSVLPPSARPRTHHLPPRLHQRRPYAASSTTTSPQQENHRPGPRPPATPSGFRRAGPGRLRQAAARVSASTPVTSRGLQPPCHTPLTSAQTSPFGYGHPAELPHPITAPHGGSRAPRQWVTPGWTSSTRAG